MLKNPRSDLHWQGHRLVELKFGRSWIVTCKRGEMSLKGPHLSFTPLQPFLAVDWISFSIEEHAPRSMDEVEQPARQLKHCARLQKQENLLDPAALPIKFPVYHSSHAGLQRGRNSPVQKGASENHVYAFSNLPSGQTSPACGSSVPHGSVRSGREMPLFEEHTGISLHVYHTTV